MPAEQWVRLWLRTLLRRDRVEADMEKELAFHIARETELNLSRGMTLDEVIFLGNLRTLSGVPLTEDRMPEAEVLLLQACETLSKLPDALPGAARQARAGILALYAAWDEASVDGSSDELLTHFLVAGDIHVCGLWWTSQRSITLEAETQRNGGVLSAGRRFPARHDGRANLVHRCERIRMCRQRH
jgi:hypothetical protein